MTSVLSDIFCASEKLKNCGRVICPPSKNRALLERLAPNCQVMLVAGEFGQHPLFYYFNGQRLIYGITIADVASQIKPHPKLNKKVVLSTIMLNPAYTDETTYDGIYRVEPGCVVYLTHKGELKKTRYWGLDPEAYDLKISSERSCFNRFTDLLEESVAYCSAGVEEQLAGEISAGMDSASILTASQQLGLSYPLFMHISNTSPTAGQEDERFLAQYLVDRFSLKNLSFVDANGFDLIQELEYASTLFAGPALYPAPVFSQNIIHAVLGAGKSILLSGIGGDECFSSYPAQVYCHADQFRQERTIAVWGRFFQEHKNCLLSVSTLKKAEKLLKSMHPITFEMLARAEGVVSLLRCLMKQEVYRGRAFYQKHHYKSVRAFEWDHLQGRASLPLRGRIEGHFTLAEAQGVEYRYPLLYPKLVDFCFHLPAKYKSKNGIGRYMVRKYLHANGLLDKIDSEERKQATVAPATLKVGLEYLKNPAVQKQLKSLPWFKNALRRIPHEDLIAWVYCYMLNHYQQSVNC